MAMARPCGSHLPLTLSCLSPNRLADALLRMTWTHWQFTVVAIAGWMNRQQQEVTRFR